jgi:hypothetical protein
MVRYCCVMCRELLESAGKRGLSIIVYEADIGPVFFLQARALDNGTQLPATSDPVSAEMEVAIKFCPWCRSNLVRTYRRFVPELARPDLVLTTH